MEKISRDQIVEFNGTNILTTVSNDSWKIEVVLSELRVSLAASDDRIIGFDIKYKSSPSDNRSTVATLQLCHTARCLVIQLPRLDAIPNSLVRFLGDATIRFVGVDILRGFAKLAAEYDCIPKRNCLELGQLIARLCDSRYSNFELSELAAEILRVVYVKSVGVAQSDWGVGVLTSEQVKYATLDAYVPLAIMKKLYTEYN